MNVKCASDECMCSMHCLHFLLMSYDLHLIKAVIVKLRSLYIIEFVLFLTFLLSHIFIRHKGSHRGAGYQLHYAYI